MHDPAKLPLAAVTEPPAGAPGYAPQFGGELRSYAGIPKTGALPQDLQRQLVHGYYAATSYMDAQLGRVLDKLDELDLTENTIVVLWGDHGWHLGDHGMWCKHTNYEQAARIPLLIAAPGIAPARTSALVETVDIYPTLGELAGLPTPAGLDGVSFAKVLRDPQQRSGSRSSMFTPETNCSAAPSAPPATAWSNGKHRVRQHPRRNTSFTTMKRIRWKRRTSQHPAGGPGILESHPGNPSGSQTTDQASR
jgi:arylsulfatase A-like enzyme